MRLTSLSNRPGCPHMTPYHHALRLGEGAERCVAIGLELLPQGRDSHQESLLESAIRHAREDVGLLLLALGRCPFELPEALDPEGRLLTHRPFECALMQGLNDFVEASLSALLAPIKDPALAAFALDGIQQQWWELEARAVASARIWREGASYMHLVAAADNAQGARILRERGYLANGRDRTGRAPLDALAIKKGSAECAIELVLAQGSLAEMANKEVSSQWAAATALFEARVIDRCLPPARAASERDPLRV